MAWSDNPATASTPIKALHINEVRRAVNFWRNYVGLPPSTWTDGPWVDSTTPMRAVHFTELKASIQDLWTEQEIGIPPYTLPAWSGGTPSSGSPIHASDINDLRSWLTTADPVLGIHVGFHWCNPEDVTLTPMTGNEASAALLSQSGYYAAVLLLDPANSTQFYDACNKILANPGADLSQSVVRLFWGTEGDPSLDDVGSVAAAETWLESNGFYDLLQTFVDSGGQMVQIFNELISIRSKWQLIRACWAICRTRCTPTRGTIRAQWYTRSSPDHLGSRQKTPSSHTGGATHPRRTATICGHLRHLVLGRLVMYTEATWTAQSPA